MTVPRFISPHFPYLTTRINVRDREFDIEALIDTGFDGEVLVPQGLLSDESLEGELRLQFADGSTVMTPMHRVLVSIGPLAPLQVVAGSLGNEFLIGIGLVRRFRLTLDHGERVIVEP